MSNGHDLLYRDRKYKITIGTLILVFIGLFTGKFSGAECVALIPLILGIFTGGNVWAKYAANGKVAETKV